MIGRGDCGGGLSTRGIAFVGSRGSMHGYAQDVRSRFQLVVEMSLGFMSWKCEHLVEIPNIAQFGQDGALAQPLW